MFVLSLKWWPFSKMMTLFLNCWPICWPHFEIYDLLRNLRPFSKFMTFFEVIHLFWNFLWKSWPYFEIIVDIFQNCWPFSKNFRSFKNCWPFSWLLTLFEILTFFKIIDILTEIVDLSQKILTFFKIVGLFRNCWPLSKLLTFFQNFRLHQMVLKYIICRIVKTVEMNHIRIESTPPGWMELQQFMIEWSTRDIPAGIITSLSWHNRQSTLFNPRYPNGELESH